jgi:multidrug resistance efflux pump
MVEPSLEYLGRQMRDVQASIRNLQQRVDLLKIKVDRLEPFLASILGAAENRLAEQLRNEADAVQAQFAQVHETMAANLATVLAAIGPKED